MRWTKRGRIFQLDGQFPWMAHHAQIPTPVVLDHERLRIYFATRDSENRSRVAFIDVDPADPSKLVYVHDRPALDLGRLGTFDDSGVMPSSVIDVGDEKHLYYIGWNIGVTVPYRVAIGLAISTDGGDTFERAYEGPIVDRNAREPYLATCPFVLRDAGAWRMWYVSGTQWVVHDDHPEPVYVIKYAESDDGVEWRRDAITRIEPKFADEACARPWVVRHGDSYRMWFSHRSSTDYRDDRGQSYNIGYAESSDGITWSRLDEQVGIALSEDGWDSEMLAYPALYEHGGTLNMLYNGNGFGASGFGHAVAGG